MTEAELLQRLKNGDESAYEDVVRTHGARAYGVARRFLEDGPDAEDAVQDAFLSAWRAIGQFDGRAALSTWLHRITVNAALARLNARSRRHETPMDDILLNPSGTEDSTELPDTRPDPLVQAELAQLVWTAVKGLEDNDRAVLVLRDVEEFPSKEVAARLGISDSAVRQRLHRARQAIAERLRPVLCEGRELTCGGRIDLLFDSIDGSLELALQLPVRDHLAACPKCRSFLELYRETIAAPRHSASWLEPDELPEGQRSAILAATRSRGDAGAQ